MHRLFTRGVTMVLRARKVSFAIYRGKTMDYEQEQEAILKQGIKEFAQRKKPVKTTKKQLQEAIKTMKALRDGAQEYLLSSDIMTSDIFGDKGYPPPVGVGIYNILSTPAQHIPKMFRIFKKRKKAINKEISTILLPEEIEYDFRYCRCNNQKPMGWNGWMRGNCTRPIVEFDRKISKRRSE